MSRIFLVALMALGLSHQLGGTRAEAADLNGDGNVTAFDAFLSARMQLGVIDASPAADVDGSGAVTALDHYYILLSVLGVRPARTAIEIGPLPVGAQVRVTEGVALDRVDAARLDDQPVAFPVIQLPCSPAALGVEVYSVATDFELNGAARPGPRWTIRVDTNRVDPLCAAQLDCAECPVARVVNAHLGRGPLSLVNDQFRSIQRHHIWRLP